MVPVELLNQLATRVPSLYTGLVSLADSILSGSSQRSHSPLPPDALPDTNLDGIVVGSLLGGGIAYVLTVITDRQNLRRNPDFVIDPQQTPHPLRAAGMGAAFGFLVGNFIDKNNIFGI